MSTLSRLILAIIHFIYTIYILIKSQWAFINSGIIKLIKPRNLKLCENILNEYDTSRIKKLPEHLIVVIGSEEISYFDVTRIIGWTVALGIPHVSFYDQDGNSNIIFYFFIHLLDYFHFFSTVFTQFFN